MTELEKQHLYQSYSEYAAEVSTPSALMRVQEVEEIRLENDMGFDEVESICIAILDSEFMRYPEDVLERVLGDYLNELQVRIQEERV
jgi:hypothetical protein